MTGGQDRDSTPSISQTLQSYLDKIFSRVPLRSEYKQEMRDELETHLEEYTDELTNLGYKPYAVDDEIIRRAGRPEEIADEYNRMESLRSWFRDPDCVRCLSYVALGYVAFVCVCKFVMLLLGLSGLDTQIAYDFDRYGVDVRLILLLLTGPVAYKLYVGRTGNTHRLTPFATLFVVLFIANEIMDCNLNFLSPLPNPQLNVSLLVNLPSPFASPPFTARSVLVYESYFSGLSADVNTQHFFSLLFPYASIQPRILTGFVLALTLATSFILEKLRQRQSFQPA